MGRVVFNGVLRRRMHRCGRGFTGAVVKTKGVIFCGTCGKEFRK